MRFKVQQADRPHLPDHGLLLDAVEAVMHAIANRSGSLGDRVIA
jgi:hypothetical protein